MTFFALIVVIGLFGGLAIGLQAPLASMINQKLGVLESVFVIHLGGLLAAAIPLAFLGGGRLSEWQSLPWYALLAGLLGVIVVGSTIYNVPRIGVAGTVTLIIAGQLTMAITIDHFGFLGVETRAISIERMLGIGIVLTGVWLTLRDQAT